MSVHARRTSLDLGRVVVHARFDPSLAGVTHPDLVGMWTVDGPTPRVVELVEGRQLPCDGRQVLRACFGIWRDAGGPTLGDVIIAMRRSRAAALACMGLASGER